MRLNKARREDLSSLMAYFCHQLWWWWGERGGWHTSVSCLVSICPPRKKLNWFLQGNKAKKREEPISSFVPDIYPVQVVTLYYFQLPTHQTDITDFNIHLDIFIAGQAVSAGLNLEPYISARGLH